MSLKGKLLRLRRMRAGEIRARLGEMLQQRRERLVYDADRPERADSALPVGQFLADVSPLVPGVDRAQGHRLQADHAGAWAWLRETTAKNATAVLSGAYCLLGCPVDLRGAIDWHKDPRSDYRWPRRFYADVNFSAASVPADVKYVWELGRQQYVAEVARGWLFDGQREQAEWTREVMLGWIEHDPLYEGVHWTSALEVAMRATSWIWAIAALADWDGWTSGDLTRISGSLAEHGSYLQHHFSRYSSPYNHLMGEATALYLIGLALPQVEEADRWRRMGRDVLCEYGPRQFHRDGFCVEQAVGYHFYTLGFLSMAVAAARHGGEPLGELETVVHAAYRAGAAFRQPDGRWPAIGDVDSARSIPVFHEDFWDFDSLCSLGGVLFDDPQLAFAQSPGPEVYWLLGCEGIERWHTLRRRTARGEGGSEARGVVLKDSGYVVAAGRGDWLLFDAGPIAHGLHADATPSVAHGHADMLQVLYWTGGAPVLQDRGIPFYRGRREWIDHFRSPAAHNTVQITGAAVAVSAGPLAWSHVAGPAELETKLSDGAWLASARASWRRGVTIQRHLLCLVGRGLWIADWIESDLARPVRWHWQLPKDALEHIVPAEWPSTLVRGDRIVFASWCSHTPLASTLQAPAEDSPVAWEALGYGMRRPAQCLQQTTMVDGRLLVVHFVGVHPVAVELTVAGEHVCCLWDGASPSTGADAHLPTLTLGDAVWKIGTETPNQRQCDAPRGRAV